MNMARSTFGQRACLVLLIVFCFCFFTVVHADAQKKKSRAIINPEGPIYPGYPMSFDGIGVLDRMDKDDDFVVINDSHWSLSGRITYNRPNALGRGPSALKEGDFVGYLLDDKGRIKSLWWLLPE